VSAAADVARSCVVLDIDGVIADVRHRLHHLAGKPKDWAAFFAAAPADPLLSAGAEVARIAAAEHDLVYLTGRPEHLHAQTQAWLNDNGLPPGLLLMRAEGDRRPGAVIKLAQLLQLGLQCRVELVVDDDPDVVATLRRAGFTATLADWMPADTASLHRAQQREGRS
jgi:hypothetical protein